MAKWVLVVVFTLICHLTTNAQSLEVELEDTSFFDKVEELAAKLNDKVEDFIGNSTTAQNKIADVIKNQLNVSAEFMEHLKETFDKINVAFQNRIQNLIQEVGDSPSEGRKRFESLNQRFVPDINGLLDVGSRFTDVLSDSFNSDNASAADEDF